MSKQQRYSNKQKETQRIEWWHKQLCWKKDWAKRWCCHCHRSSEVWVVMLSRVFLKTDVDAMLNQNRESSSSSDEEWEDKTSKQVKMWNQRTKSSNNQCQQTKTKQKQINRRPWQTRQRCHRSNGRRQNRQQNQKWSENISVISIWTKHFWIVVSGTCRLMLLRRYLIHNFKMYIVMCYCYGVALRVSKKLPGSILPSMVVTIF